MIRSVSATFQKIGVIPASACMAAGSLTSPLMAAHHRVEVKSNDPVSYCHAVGTIDEPSTGSQAPRWMFRAVNEEPDPNGNFFVTWRCDAGRVMACHTGPEEPSVSRDIADPERQLRIVGYF